MNLYGGYDGWDGGSGFDWVSRTPRTSVMDLTGAGTRAIDMTGNSYARPVIDGFTF